MSQFSNRLEAGEDLAAFLGDLYHVTTPTRARPALDDVTRTVEQHGVWCGGGSQPAACGFVALGVPIRHAEFVQCILTAKLN